MSEWSEVDGVVELPDGRRVRGTGVRRPRDGAPDPDFAATERVELACAGGRGRTGSALAVLAVLSGVSPADAVAWVREHYHPKAVETRSQRRWIEDVGRSLAA